MRSTSFFYLPSVLCALGMAQFTDTAVGGPVPVKSIFNALVPLIFA